MVRSTTVDIEKAVSHQIVSTGVGQRPANDGFGVLLRSPAADSGLAPASANQVVSGGPARPRT